VSLSPGALAKGGTQAGSLNQNIRASSGPSGDGPSGSQSRTITRRACVLTGRKPQRKDMCGFRPVRRRALRNAPYTLLFIGTYSDNAGPV
jgi:hypothetical protein